MWWNDKIKLQLGERRLLERGLLAASDEETKERCIEAYRNGVGNRAKEGKEVVKLLIVELRNPTLDRKVLR